MCILRAAVLTCLTLAFLPLSNDPSLLAEEIASFKVADFESEESLSGVRTRDTATERVRDGSREGGHALRWSVPPTNSTVGISIPGVPADVRAFRAVRLRVRAAGRSSDVIHFRLRSGEGVLDGRIEGFGPEWRDVEFLLPEMRELGDGFDPTRVDSVRLVAFGSRGLNLFLDDIELVKAPGGWQYSKEEWIVRAFGEKRARKVRTIETDHFLVHTDSSAARRKFPVALEKTYDFVREALGVPEMSGKLPAYVFQSKTLYHDFCVRKGWPRDAAQSTAGHANAEYFSTFYQSPKEAVVTHELTHSVFHRTMGAGGGSWFQEGVAVYVEEKWQRKSAAKTFAPQLRSGRFVPLREFFAVPKLIAGRDSRGGPRSGHAMYAQAGAFFEFLLKGPYAESRPDAIKELSQLNAAGEARVKAIEKILGASSEEIEAVWKQTGSRFR